MSAVRWFVASLLFLNAHSLWAIETSQLAGTEWYTTGSAKLNARPGGSATVSGYCIVSFDENGLFQTEDSSGAVMNGTWSVDAQGKPQVVVTPANIENFIYTYLPDGYGDYIDDITINSVVNQVTITTKNGIGALTYKFSFKAVISVQGQTATLTYAMSVKGGADLSGQAPVATQWNFTNASYKYTAGKIKLSSKENLRLDLGPTDELAANQFAFYRGADTAPFLQGRYFRIGSQLALVPDTEMLTEFLSATAAEQAGTVYPGPMCLSCWSTRNAPVPFAVQRSS